MVLTKNQPCYPHALQPARFILPPRSHYYLHSELDGNWNLGIALDVVVDGISHRRTIRFDFEEKIPASIWNHNGNLPTEEIDRWLSEHLRFEFGPSNSGKSVFFHCYSRPFYSQRVFALTGLLEA